MDSDYRCPVRGKVGLVACSDPLKVQYRDQDQQLKDLLGTVGLKTVESPAMYDGAVTYEAKAAALMNMYLNPDVEAIFDISGGNLALGVLDHLDYDAIAGCCKPLWGYSDLTTVINGIYAKTGMPSVLYQVKNAIWDSSGTQQHRLSQAISAEGDELFRVSWRMLQGREIDGVLIGGNLRCLLKLSGTEFMPRMTDKVLLLESRGGTEEQLRSMLTQMRIQGAFGEIKGLVLGTFTEADRTMGREAVLDMVLGEVDNPDLPVAATEDVGHSPLSRAIWIGKPICIG